MIDLRDLFNKIPNKPQSHNIEMLRSTAEENFNADTEARSMQLEQFINVDYALQETVTALHEVISTVLEIENNGSSDDIPLFVGEDVLTAVKAIYRAKRRIYGHCELLADGGSK